MKIKFKKVNNSNYSLLKNPNWQTNLTKYSKGIKKFHYEIFDYIKNKILPNENYNEKKEKTIELLNQIIKLYYPSSKIFLYGSSIQNLETNESDIDISILLNINNTDFTEISFLENLKEILINEKFSNIENTELIDAKVPIIKTICNETNFKIDISLNQTDGINFSELIKNFIINHPILKYMIVFIKRFFSLHNLNNCYNNGMSSYCIFIYVTHFYQVYRKENLINLNFANFFIGFLNYYVNKFDYKNNGISIKEGGKVFPIKSRYHYNNLNNNDMKICIESYIDDENDVGKYIDYNKIYLLLHQTLYKIYQLLEDNENDCLSFLSEIGFS